VSEITFTRVALASGMLLMLAMAAKAQPAAKQEVPDNIAGTAVPAQPLPYSHKTHISRGLQCRMCHTNPDPGGKMTFPEVATCMGCHNTVAKERPAIIKLTEMAKSGQPIPWVRVYEVTPGVIWSHRRHLQAGMQCVMCHGQVGQLDVMQQTTAVTSMASCISCHQTHKANTTCLTCHAWPSGE
jgi:hypothetical protein